MVNLAINQKRKTAIAITATLLLLSCSASANFALADDFQPPQNPNYNLSPGEQQNYNITIPSDPNSQTGTPQSGGEAEPTSTPTDYTPIIILAITAIVIIGIVGLAIVKKRKAPQSPT